MAPLSGLEDGLLDALAANCGNAYLHGARPMGKPWRVEEDLVLSDLGLPIALPPNNATVLRSANGPDASRMIAERVRDFFSASPGGGYEVWSIWPGLDLASFGFAPERVPCLIRDLGGEAPRGPVELRVSEVEDDSGMRDAWRVIDEVFCDRRTPEPYWDARVLRDDYRVWVGYVDGRAVTTATAFVDGDFVGVYAVATLAEARGRGYGEAVTWAATLCRRDLPATLQASEMGRPVYERMGYRTVATFTVWERERES